MTTKFYTFGQTNSGGSFVLDRVAGLSHFVIIEAHSADEANSIAEDKGIYFNGCDNDLDCACCGDRWNPVFDSDGEFAPLVYDKNPAQYKDVFTKDGDCHTYVHYLDGTMIGFQNPRKFDDTKKLT